MLGVISIIACIVLFLVIMAFVFSPQVFASMKCKPMKEIPNHANDWIRECHS